MMTINKYRKRILDEPTYWIEKINGLLYDAIVNYMEANNLKRKDLAEYLNISRGRVSQILNNGESNFSLETLIKIVLKLYKFMVVDFEDKEAFLLKEKKAI